MQVDNGVAGTTHTPKGNCKDKKPFDDDASSLVFAVSLPCSLRSFFPLLRMDLNLLYIRCEAIGFVTDGLATVELEWSYQALCIDPSAVFALAVRE